MKKTFLAVWLAACAFIATAQTITGKYEIPTMPDWAKNAVFYQIYPQTFCDSDGDATRFIRRRSATPTVMVSEICRVSSASSIT